MKRDISIIIPTYNEADNIKKLVSEVFYELKKAKIKGELIIVDDNSPDGTGKIADELSKKFNVKVIHRAGKLGLGSAVTEGFKIAKSEIVGVMDADLSHPPEAVPRVALPLIHGEADFVIGSRYEPGGGIENWPIRRRITSDVARLMCRHLTNAGDPMSGFFMFKKKLLKDVSLKHKGYKICLEMLVKINPKKLKEVAYIFRNRDVGKSKMGANEYINYIRNLVSLTLYKFSLK